MSKKKDEAALSEPERSEPAVYESKPPVAIIEAPAVAAGSSTFEEWAEAKGHIKRLPKPGRPRAAYVQPGPDYRVVKMHTRWPANQLLTEAQYDAAVVETYSAEIRER